MPKIHSSYVEICESSRPRLARVSPASRPKILNCYPRRSIIMVAISGGGRVVGVQSVLKILNLDFR